MPADDDDLAAAIMGWREKHAPDLPALVLAKDDEGRIIGVRQKDGSIIPIEDADVPDALKDAARRMSRMSQGLPELDA